MGYSINIDWREEFEKDYDKWENHGRNVLRSSCNHKQLEEEDWCEKCGISEDSCEPMMNYAYPLETIPDEDKILKVVQNTCLTIMENNETGEYFLVLCGGGMDLSQSIALAYIYAETWMPNDLISSVCTQPCLSVSKSEYNILSKQIVRQLKMESARFKHKSKEWLKIRKNWKIK